MVTQAMHNLFAIILWKSLCSELLVGAKNPGPEDQALISPQRGGVCRQLTNGIMEWWKNGILGMVSAKCLDFNF